MRGNPLIEALFDVIEDELVVVGDDRRLIMANKAVKQRYGISEIGEGVCYQVLFGFEGPCRGSFWSCPLGEVLESRRGKMLLLSEGSNVEKRYIKVVWTPLQDPWSDSWVVVELRSDVTAERELERVLLSRRHQLQVLSRISSAISSPKELDQVLQVALDDVLELVNGSVGGILIVEGRELRYRVHRGLPAPDIGSLRISIGDGIAGKVVENTKPLIGTEEEARFHPDFSGLEGIGTFISIPLMAKDRVVGVMNVASAERRTFGEEEVFLLTTLGYFLGTVIEQARLNERLAKARERYQALLQHALTAQEQERKRIARELHDETSQAITSLTLSLQALLEMAKSRGIGDAEFLERLYKAYSYAVYAGNEVIKLMKELRPTLLDELGLATAIHTMLRRLYSPGA